MSSRCFLKGRQAVVCRYLVYLLPNSNIRLRLPLLHIRLESDTDSLTTTGLVDSGSTCTFIPTEISEILELPHIKDDQAVGAGGRFPTRVKQLKTMALLTGSRIFGKFRDIQVHVPTAPEAIPYPVLGRDTIFRLFQITFREEEEKVIFRRHPSRRRRS